MWSVRSDGSAGEAASQRLCLGTQPAPSFLGRSRHGPLLHCSIRHKRPCGIHRWDSRGPIPSVSPRRTVGPRWAETSHRARAPPGSWPPERTPSASVPPTLLGRGATPGSIPTRLRGPLPPAEQFFHPPVPWAPICHTVRAKPPITVASLRALQPPHPGEA